jgi:hypothetical protein
MSKALQLQVSVNLHFSTRSEIIVTWKGIFRVAGIDSNLYLVGNIPPPKFWLRVACLKIPRA